MNLGITAKVSSGRVGLDLTISPLPDGIPYAASDVWTLGGWKLQFVHIGPGQRLKLNQADGTIYIKVILGDLTNLEQQRFAPFKQTRDTVVTTDFVDAGVAGALVTVIIETSTVAANIHSMDEVTFKGPFSEEFEWVQFDQSHIGKSIPYFKGLDAHLLPGFHLLDTQGDEIIYVHFWSAGKGVDMSPHDHSLAPTKNAPAFTETHWVFNNGTGKGGMYDCDPTDRKKRTYITMQRGQDHGPFWAINEDTGMPRFRENGAIEFGFHGWQAGNDNEPQQAYDLVGAFEMNQVHSKV